MPKRKTRTREHVIADISENHFESFALMKGFSTESTASDYGYDIILSTYRLDGEIENGFVLIQLKATDSINLIKKDSFVSFSIDKRDLSLWLEEFYPVILVVYDAKSKKGYWLYMQAYCQAKKGFSLMKINSYYNVRIPVGNRINQGAMMKFKIYKQKMLDQVQSVLHSV